MFKFTTCLMAVGMAVTAISASAQNSTSNNDLFGQDVPSMNEPAAAVAQPIPRRTRIANNEGEYDDSGNESGAARRVDRVQSDQPGTRSPRQDRLAPRSSGFRTNDRMDSDASINEFQKFMLDRTGELLHVFGADFFANSAAGFTPLTSAPPPADHPLGPGDELLIRGSGTIDIDYRATIDRNGTISIPTVGTVVLAGVKAGAAEGVVRNAIAKLYKGVIVSVTFGRLRGITVYVVGQARRPGTYTVSSLSTTITALFASGGPNATGSMRRVQVRRAGRTVAELDLYAFIGKGDKSSDVKLQDGDSIYIPPAGGFVGLIGMVNTPAIYELKASGDTVDSLLDVAGGLPVTADPRRAFLERIDPSKSQPRSVEQFALSGAAMKRSLKDGDVLNVTSITPDFSNAVVLRGNVDQAVRVPFKTGMRVSDLIPNRQYLITRGAIKRQNSSVLPPQRKTRTAGETSWDPARMAGEGESLRKESEGSRMQGDSVEQLDSSIASRIGALSDEINWDYAVVERLNRADLTVSLIPFNLGRVFTDPAGADNVQLQPGDTITVFSQQDVAVPMDKRRVFARIEGEVNVPGVYQMGAGETLQSLLAKAGGPTANAYLFGIEFYREQVRKEQQINLEKAAMRLESQLRSEQARGLANVSALSAADAQAASSQRQMEMQIATETINRFRQLKATGRIAFSLATNETSFARLPQLKLENGDRLIIPSRPEFVHVFGSVNAEASPLWRANSRVKDYLRIAGVNADADIDNVFVIRVDGTVVTRSSTGWLSTGVSSLEVMPGDSIVIPEKFDKETSWTKFTKGTREWAQIFANFGLGAAAIKTLRD